MIGKPCIIAPDSSHWSLWLDAMRSPKADVRRKEPILDALMGDVRKAADFEALLEKK